MIMTELCQGISQYVLMYGDRNSFYFMSEMLNFRM